MSLETVLLKIVFVIDQQAIPYAIMGGLAVRVHAIPRFTNDVDLTLSIERSDLQKLFLELEASGIEIAPPYKAGWLDSVSGLPLLKVHAFIDGRAFDCDLFIAETPFQHSLIARRQLIETPNGRFYFVSAEDLILLKIIASRPRDLIDVQDIFFTKGELDLGYMRHWAQELGVTQSLERAIATAP